MPKIHIFLTLHIFCSVLCAVCLTSTFIILCTFAGQIKCVCSACAVCLKVRLTILSQLRRNNMCGFYLHHLKIPVVCCCFELSWGNAPCVFYNCKYLMHEPRQRWFELAAEVNSHFSLFCSCLLFSQLLSLLIQTDGSGLLRVCQAPSACFNSS